MLTVIHDDHVLRVEYDEQHNWLIVSWQPQQDVDASRHGCAVLLGCLRQYRCRRILNDSRAVCTFWADAAESIGSYFAAELVALGVERAAWLNGSSIYDQLSTRQTMALRHAAPGAGFRRLSGSRALAGFRLSIAHTRTTNLRGPGGQACVVTMLYPPWFPMSQLLHESPILSVSFEADEEWIYANWQRVRNLADVQAGCAVILHHVEQTGSRRILNDNRLVYTFWAEAAEWVGRTYLPQLAAAGVRQLAWINAHSIYGRLSISQALVYVERPHTQLFDDYDEAVAWLRAAD